MKKTYFILWFIISFFIFYSKVEAGVCNGLTNHKYCDSPFGDITFISGHTDSETGFSSSNGKYVREEYKAKLTDGGYTAFCLDPGTTVPTSSTLYKKVRELDISTPLDIGIYKMYQKFINDTQYRIQSNTYDSKIATLYRAHLQFGLRSWLVDKSVDFTVSAAYKDYANGFKECSGYMKNSNSKKDTYCFSDITNREAIKKYYESASKPYTWKNPFEKGKNINDIVDELECNPYIIDEI